MPALLRNILLFFVFLLFLLDIAKIYPNLSDGAKKYQLAFLVPFLGMDSISILGDCAKKSEHSPSSIHR
jgi:hypothetical protein